MNPFNDFKRNSLKGETSSYSSRGENYNGANMRPATSDLYSGRSWRDM